MSFIYLTLFLAWACCTVWAVRDAYFNDRSPLLVFLLMIFTGFGGLIIWLLLKEEIEIIESTNKKL